MLKKMVTILLMIIAAAWFGVEIADDPGYAFFAYRHWTVEMPLWLLLGGLIAIFFLFHFFHRLIAGIMDFFAGWRRWSKERRIKYALKKTEQGFLALAEGKWRLAENTLIQAAHASEQPFIQYLTAARAAQEQGKDERRDDYLAQAQRAIPESTVAVNLTKLSLQLNHEQLYPSEMIFQTNTEGMRQALTTLKHLHNAIPKHRYVLQLLLNVCQRLHDWKTVIPLMPFLKKQKIYNKAEWIFFEREVYRHLLLNEIADVVELGELKKSWNKIPKSLRHEEELVLIYVCQLKKGNYHNEAEMLLRDVLAFNWKDKLIREYGLTKSDNLQQQLHRAEAWLKKNGNNLMLLLTLGRLAMANQLWGQAKYYLQECLKVSDCHEAQYEYAELLCQFKEHSNALQQYRLTLRQVLNLKE